jgi:cellulose synthase/poly-beta-1,6-N-acetylglucosamine synthase-like glycosyltransferase
MMHWIIGLAAALLILLTLPGTIELAILTFANLLPPRDERSGIRKAPIGKLAIVIPAHDESATISRCVESIAACAAPAGIETPIIVVADNCTDDTAELARTASARVMVRNDDARRGKGFALHYAFAQLLSEGVDAVLVVDADSTMERGTLLEVARVLLNGADGVQVCYKVLNPDASMRARLMNVAFMAFNILRPRGRQRLGLSVGILGNGFALSRATLAAVPYDAHSIVEDLEYHLRLVRAGRRVQFTDKATVRGLMPTSGTGVRTQRTRWEGGRLSMIVQHAPRLAREVVAGRWRLLEPMLELLLLPLAFHVTMLLIALAIPNGAARAYAVAALALVTLHVGAGVIVGGGGMRDLAALAVAPFYVLWKLAAAPGILRSARRATPWIRTSRQ